MRITGGCLCGAIRYETDAAPLATRFCWCRVCQYIGGGSGTVNAVFPRDAVHITGTPREYVSMADSGNRMHRQFCGACGTPLFNHAEERPQLLVVRVGTFDDPEQVRPQVTIWTDSAPTWCRLDPDVPQVPRQPPPLG